MAGHLFTLNNKKIDLDTFSVSSCPKVHANYDPKVQSRKLEKFLRELTCGDEDLLAYLQEVLASCLTTRHSKVLYVFYGVGSAGKSSLLSLMQALLGSMCERISSSILGPANKSSSMIRDSRMIIIEDLDIKASDLSGGAIKTLTGAIRFGEEQKVN
ncbi:Hypothetical protein POVR1_LOCUS96 [uncultured virus]|nr:Hypothetical protein POVR1_LOCUS96 [uncultured virus]